MRVKLDITAIRSTIKDNQAVKPGVFMGSDLTNDLLDQSQSSSESEVATELHPLHALQQAIANMPDLDPEKVQAAINKIRSGNFAMLGSIDEQLACAERIAKQIIDES